MTTNIYHNTTKLVCLFSLGLLIMGCQEDGNADDAITSIPDFKSIKDVKQKKTSFFEFMAPIARAENLKIYASRQWLEGLNVASMSADDTTQFNALADKYQVEPSDNKVNMKDELLNRVDIVPASMVLAQSANESSWGTSRFAKQGFNFFGQWCFTKGCGIVPGKRTSGMTHEVRKFDSVNESVAGYMFNLNTNNAFKVFRQIRSESRAKNEALTGHNLIAGLINYSERKHEYIKEIRAMIRINKLAAYNNNYE